MIIAAIIAGVIAYSAVMGVLLAVSGDTYPYNDETVLAALFWPLVGPALIARHLTTRSLTARRERRQLPPARAIERNDHK